VAQKPQRIFPLLLSFVVGDGGTVSVLMRIKKEWFDEDQAKKAAHVDEQEQAMKQNASKEFTGSIKIS
jgi:hypothetical protein